MQIDVKLKRQKLGKKFSWTPYLFLLPAIAFLGLTSFLPVLQAIYLSFTDYDFVGSPTFTGWRNYINLFKDQTFWKTLGNTLTYLIFAVPSLVVLPLFLAILVNQKLRSINFFRAIYYFPVIVSVVVAGIAWKWVYAQNGILNYFLSAISFQSVTIPWLTDPKTAIFAIIAVVVWRGVGYYMVIYLAGLQAIPADLYEAAAIDGSDGWQKHWDITIPLMKPYIILVAVISAIGAMKVFEEVYIMSQGGPANSTKTVVYYLYDKGFTSLEMGYASAIGVFLFLIIFIISILTFKFINPAKVII
ncbi:carbohydrate ABC transporter permease [Pseudanabaena sp. UWO310]|uniref:carbohydrate ABC transporter permease n=1 Tax=Pseudanabaena sp. UWO310 TaxID=2480795 RepID=UPI0011604185|nr:sugar ABC transporter permease [Pseudanabaena sp. UWO310]TYQ25061.1 sugar ABC transporter permease [Pseudanabaena sp. UWO310]